MNTNTSDYVFLGRGVVFFFRFAGGSVHCNGVCLEEQHKHNNKVSLKETKVLSTSDIKVFCAYVTCNECTPIMFTKGVA